MLEKLEIIYNTGIILIRTQKKSLIIVDDGKMPHIAIWARDAKMKIAVIVVPEYYKDKDDENEKESYYCR